MIRQCLSFTVLVFAIVSTAAAQTPLEGTYWRLIAIDGEDVNAGDPAMLPHIALHAEGSRVAGFSGCNRFFAVYEVDGERLKITPMGGGRLNCPDAIVAEPRFLQKMAATASHRIDGDVLTLTTGGSGELVFRAVAQ